LDFEEFDVLVEDARAVQAGRGLPGEIRFFDSWRASEADIERAESELTVRLPQKYKEFMRRYGGGMFLYVDLLPIVTPDGRTEDLLEVNGGEFDPAHFVAVAPVGTGDWWGFMVVNGIYMLFHDDGSATKFADDFLEFVARQGLRVA
jgi:antitoxin YobK